MHRLGCRSGVDRSAFRYAIGQLGTGSSSVWGAGGNLVEIRLLAVSAALGAATFAVLEGVQSVVREDHSFAAPMSVYAVGAYGFVQTIAFVALGLGSLALPAGLRQPVASPEWTLGRALLATWALGVLLAAAFPIDSVPAVHGAASFVSFVAILAAMFVFARACRSVARWRSFAAPSTWLARSALAAFLVAVLTQPSFAFGVAQRVFLAAVVGWIIATALRLHAAKIGSASAGTHHNRRAQ